MPDPIERKRLKKKMLDRWENEGGKIGADSTRSDDAKWTSEHEGQSEQISAARGKPMVVSSASSAKRRKAARN